MRYLLRLITFWAAVGVFAPRVSEAQTDSTPSWPSVAQMLLTFETEMARSDGRGRIPAGVTHTLAHADSFAPARVDSLLDGLQRLALTSENNRVALMAVVVLASSADRHSARPLAGVTDRLRSIIDGAASSGARRTAMHRLPLQCDVTTAVRALEAEAASTPEAQSYPGSARDAVALLRDTGGRGREALLRLHRGRRVQEPEARAELERQLREM